MSITINSTNRTAQLASTSGPSNCCEGEQPSNPLTPEMLAALKSMHIVSIGDSGQPPLAAPGSPQAQTDSNAAYVAWQDAKQKALESGDPADALARNAAQREYVRQYQNAFGERPGNVPTKSELAPKGSAQAQTDAANAGVAWHNANDRSTVTGDRTDVQATKAARAEYIRQYENAYGRRPPDLTSDSTTTPTSQGSTPPAMQGTQAQQDTQTAYQAWQDAKQKALESGDPADALARNDARRAYVQQYENTFGERPGNVPTRSELAPRGSAQAKSDATNAGVAWHNANDRSTVTGDRTDIQATKAARAEYIRQYENAYGKRPPDLTYDSSATTPPTGTPPASPATGTPPASPPPADTSPESPPTGTPAPPPDGAPPTSVTAPPSGAGTPMAGSEADHAYGEQRRFALHELQKDWNDLNGKNSGDPITRETLQTIVDESTDHHSSEYRAAKFFLDHPEEYDALDKADGKVNDGVSWDGIVKQLETPTTDGDKYALEFDKSVNAFWDKGGDLKDNYTDVTDNDSPMSKEMLTDMSTNFKLPEELRNAASFFLNNPDAFKQADANGDGALSINEIQNAGNQDGVFVGWDRNGDSNGVAS